jgi:hypothetical protein
MADETSFIRVIIEGRDRLSGAARSAAQSLDQLNRAQREQAPIADRARDSQGRFVSTTSDLDKEVKKTTTSFEKYTRSIKNNERSISDAAFSLKRYVSELDRLARKADLGSRQSEQLNRLSQAARSLARSVTEQAKAQDQTTRSTQRATQETRRLGTETDRTARSVERAGRSARGAGRDFNRLGSNIATVDNELRGLGIFAAALSFQQLITAAAALGGQLVAVASSAALAGAALGGALVAGAGQAIPVLGLLTASLVRVKQVTDAVGQAQKLQQATAVQGNQVANQTRDAAERVRNAQENVADATRRVSDAQEGLRESRRQGVRELRDLIDAEREAELAARGAALGQKEAQEALRRAVQEGRTGDVERAELGVEEAASNRSQSLVRLQRARQDAQRARRSGVEGLDSVRQASRAVQDAQRALVQTRRQVAGARQDAEDTGKAALAAASTLTFMLAQLSPAERRLYNSFQRIQNTFRRNIRPITDIIINAFAQTTDRANSLLGDQRLLAPLRRLAVAGAESINRLTAAFTDNRSVNLFASLTDNAAKNIERLTPGAISFGRAIQNIAEAGQPALARIVGITVDIAKGFERLTSDQGRLAEIFDFGVDRLEEWLDLVGAIARLAAAIVAPGGDLAKGAAASGGRTVVKLTETINGFANSLNDNAEKVDKFFRSTEKGLNIILHLFGEVAKAFAPAFNIDHLRSLARFLETVLVPALATTVQMLGDVVNILSNIFSTEDFLGINISSLAKNVVTVTLLAAAFTKLGTAGKFFVNIFRAAAAPLVRVFSLLTGITGVAGGARGVLARLGLGGLAAGGAAAKATDLLASRGATPAKPMYVFVVNQTGLIAGGAGGKGGTVAGGARGGIIGGAAGLARGLGAGALLAGLFGAATTSGNLFERLQGGASTASLGLIPRPRERQSPEDREVSRATRAVNRLAAQGDVAGLRRQAEAIGQVADEFERFGGEKNRATAGRLRAIAEAAEPLARLARRGINVKLDSTDAVKQAKLLENAFSTLERNTSNNIRDLRTSIRFNMRLIASDTTASAEETKQALSANYRAAIRNVKNSIREGTIASQDGLREIRRLLRENLKLYGFTEAQARNVVRGQRYDGGPNEGSAPIGRAGGGWVGQAGERGKDTVRTVLGRGEAVLNWAHQKMVDPALRQVYGFGLDELFKKRRGIHGGAPPWENGMARGGFAGGVDGSGKGFVPLMRYLGSRFGPMYVMSGLRPGSTIAGSGRVSNHAFGNAVDISVRGLEGANQGTPPESLNAAGARRLDRVYAFARQRIQPQIGLDLLWRTLTGGNHYNHVHMGVQGRYSHNVALMRKFIATLPKGGDFSLDGIKRIRSRARGTFGAISQRVLDLARDAANSILNSAADQSFMEGGGQGNVGARPEEVHGGALSRSRVASIFRQAFSEALPYRGFTGMRPGWLGNLVNLAYEESTWNPNAQNKTAAGLAAGLPQGILQVVGNTFRAYAKPGMNNPFNPLHNAVASIRYQLSRYGDIRRHAPYAAGGFVGEFAKGGQVPGDPDRPVPILAHAGEWVVNKRQQEVIARLAGTTKDHLKQALGFSGGPSGFQGGGEVRGGALINQLGFLDPKAVGAQGTELRKRMENILKGIYELPTDALNSVKDITQEMQRAFRAIGNIGRKDKDRFKQFSDNLDAFTGEGGLLDQLGAETEKLTTRLSTRTLRGAVAAIKGAVLTIDGRSQALLRSTRSETRTIEVELKNLAEVSSSLYGQRSGIRRASRRALDNLKDVNREIRLLERKGISNDEKKEYEKLLKDRRRIVSGRENLRQRLDDIDEAIAQNINDRLERQRDLFEAQTKQAVTGSSVGIGGTRRRIGPELVLRALDSISSVTEAFGRQTAESIESIGQQRLAALRNQQAILAQRRDEAVRRGFTDIADGLQEQIEDIGQQIQEGTAALLNDVIQATTENFERGRSRLDLSGRIGDALGRIGLDSFIPGVGNLGGTTRAGIFGARDASFRSEISALQPLIGRALQEGNIGAFNTLTDRINDLSIAILENSEQLRLARVDEVNRPVQLQTALTGTFTQIFELQRKLGLISGETQRDATRNSLNSLGQALQNQAAGLQQLLAEANLAGNQAAANDLTQQIAENTLAQLQNTDAIKTLEGAINVQSFTSSFWTGFRQALFTGEGALVPRFSTPSSVFGATAMWPGSLPSGSMASSASNQNIVNFDIDRAGEPIDANEIVSKVLFATGSRDR